MLVINKEVMNTGNSLLCFIAGAVAGAVAAVLLAPDSGAKTRGRIKEDASDAVGMAKSKLAEALGILEKALEEK